jgi:hypothetical protein
MRDNLFWFIAFVLGIPLAIWGAIKRFFSWLFGKK